MDGMARQTQYGSRARTWDPPSRLPHSRRPARRSLIWRAVLHPDDGYFVISRRWDDPTRLSFRCAWWTYTVETVLIASSGGVHRADDASTHHCLSVVEATRRNQCVPAASRALAAAMKRFQGVKGHCHPTMWDTDYADGIFTRVLALDAYRLRKGNQGTTGEPFGKESAFGRQLTAIGSTWEQRCSARVTKRTAMAV